jgi:hypothetical protein
MTAEWVFNGHDLTVAGDYFVSILSGYDLPNKRNGNVLVPLQDGKTHANKYYDERTITLGVTIQGTSATDLKTNIDTLLGYFGGQAQGTLVHTLPDNSTRQAYAEVVSSLDLQYFGPSYARGTIDFLCSDPYFRSPTVYSATAAATAGTTLFDVVNSGNGDEHNAVISFSGPSNHPKLEHIANGVWVQYNANIGAGTTVTVDCHAYTAVMGTANVINSIVHHGNPSFITFNAGTNHCRLIDAGTAGTVTVSFYPPFLSP